MAKSKGDTSRFVWSRVRSWGAAGLRALRSTGRFVGRCWPSSAVWSSFAAFAAAIAAWLSFTTQQQSTANAIRPELILAGWRSEFTRSGNAPPLQFTVSSIRNIGVGPALKVVGFTLHTERHAVFSMGVPVIGACDTVPAAGLGIVKWGTGKRWRVFRIHVGYSDVNDKRYETVYQMVATDDPYFVGAERLADGLYSTFRFTAPVRQGWWPFAWPECYGNSGSSTPRSRACCLSLDS